MLLYNAFPRDSSYVRNALMSVSERAINFPDSLNVSLILDI